MKLYDQTQLAEMLGISVRTLARHVKADKVPAPVEFGNTKRWTAEQVDQWLRRKAGGAND